MTRPGLLWQIGRALGECGLDVRAARVETLGAEAVDVFYVTDAAGAPVTDAGTRGRIAAAVLSALPGDPGAWPAADSLGPVFETLSDRLTQVFSSLRGEAGCRPPTSTRPAARSASPCSRRTSPCRWPGSSSPG